MAYDWHVEALIQEAQEAARRPMKFKDLKPHERAMVQALGRVLEKDRLTNDEILSGVRNVLTYVELILKKRQREANYGM